VSEAEAREHEPRVCTHRVALWSPSTATLSPRQALRALARECTGLGVQLRLGRAVTGRRPEGLRLGGDTLPCRVMVNAAGLYADRIAAWEGVGTRYRIAPFRGLYLHARAGAPPLNTCVYPVPEPDMPFLGVHFTPTVDGGHHIGPTAMPALWREQYRGVERLAVGEAAAVCWRHLQLMAGDPGFRALARREIGKVSRRILVRRARPLLRRVHARDYLRWGRPGIRAQLLDLATGDLVDDFVVARAERSVHVLNAVSPAFTCALPFAERVADAVEEQL